MATLTKPFDSTRSAPVHTCCEAQCHLRNGDLDQAGADASEAIRLDPSDADCYASRAGIAYASRDMDSALADADRAIQLDPKNSSALVVRGRCAAERGNLEQALTSVNEALRLDPKGTKALRARSWILVRREDVANALADLNQCLQLDPKNVDALAGRSFLHMKRGELDLALADADAALKLSPHDTRALETRAAILMVKLTRAKPAAEPCRAITPVTGNLSFGAEAFRDSRFGRDHKDRTKADEIALAAANDAVSRDPQSRDGPCKQGQPLHHIACRR